MARATVITPSTLLIATLALVVGALVAKWPFFPWRPGLKIVLDAVFLNERHDERLKLFGEGIDGKNLIAFFLLYLDGLVIGVVFSDLAHECEANIVGVIPAKLQAGFYKAGINGYQVRVLFFHLQKNYGKNNQSYLQIQNKSKK